jgi:hypothetical protein
MRLTIRIEIERDTEPDLLNELMTACQAIPNAVAQTLDALDGAERNVQFDAEAITGRSYLAGLIEK